MHAFVGQLTGNTFVCCPHFKYRSGSQFCHWTCISTVHAFARLLSAVDSFLCADLNLCLQPPTVRVPSTRPRRWATARMQTCLPMVSWKTAFPIQHSQKQLRHTNLFFSVLTVLYQSRMLTCSSCLRCRLEGRQGLLPNLLEPSGM